MPATSPISGFAAASSLRAFACPIRREASFRRACNCCNFASNARNAPSRASTSGVAGGSPRRFRAVSKACGFSRMNLRSCMREIQATEQVFWHGRGSGAKLNYCAEELMSDEDAIRDVIATWIAATKAGDTQTVLRLIHDDALFMVPGVAPFGKIAFAQASDTMKRVSFEGESEVLEIEVLGNVAWCRTRLSI